MFKNNATEELLTQREELLAWSKEPGVKWLIAEFVWRMTKQVGIIDGIRAFIFIKTGKWFGKLY